MTDLQAPRLPSERPGPWRSPPGGRGAGRSRILRPLRVVGLAAIALATSCDSGDPGPAPESIPVEAPADRDGTGLFDDSGRIEVLRLQAARDVPGLIARLDAERAAVRSRAAFALASARDPTAAGPLLTTVTNDPDSTVRREAAFALGHLLPPDGDRELAEVLESEQVPEVRTALIRALGLRGGPRALDALLAVDPDSSQSPALALALSRLGLRTGDDPPAALPDRLIEWLGHESRSVRMGAAYYFGRLADPGPWRARADEVRAGLDRLDRADPAAIALVEGVGRLEDPDDAERLVGWIRDAEDWRIRVSAVRAVGTTRLLESPGVREALWERVETDPYEHVAIEAANSLLSGFRVPLDVQDRADEWVESGPERWRAKFPFLAHRIALGRVDEVVRWLDRHADHSAELARAAPALLARTGHESAMERVSGFLDHPSVPVRTAAMAVLARRPGLGTLGTELQQEHFERFEKALFEEHPWVAAKAADGLSNPSFHAFGAVRVLQDAWAQRIEGARDEQLVVLAGILDALALLGDPAAAPFIEDALRDADFRVRRAAGEAYQTLTGQEVRGLGVPVPGVELDPALLSRLGPEPELVLVTESGTLRVRLAPERAPLTVQAVSRWIEEGRYDGSVFHRVIANFVTQGGDFTGGDGSGDPGVTLRTEMSGIPFRRGVIGMASSGHDTEGSQFFLAHSPQPHLDGSVGAGDRWQAFTSFGWVVDGESVLDRLMEGDRILEARIESGTGGDR